MKQLQMFNANAQTKTNELTDEIVLSIEIIRSP